MEKYNEYKDSGVEWLGEIPKEWNTNRLTFLGEFSKGGGISKADLTEEGEAVVLYGDIYTKYDIQTKAFLRRTSKEIAAKSKEIMLDDILFTGSGETVEDIGKSIVYLGRHKAYAGGDVLILRPFGVNSLYLSYVLNCNEIKAENAKLAKGQIIIHIYASQLKNITVPIPPLSEQTKIAKYLDHKTSQIDKLITDKEKLIKLLNEEHTAIINQTVTKGLNPDAPMKDSGIEWVGEVPEHWEVKKIGSLSECITGYAFKSEQFSFDEGTKLVRGDNVTEGSLRWGDKARFWKNITTELEKFYLEAYDIVIGMDGSKVGKNFALVKESEMPLLLVQRVARIRAKSPILAKYINYSIGSYNFKYHVNLNKTDPAIPHITLKNITDFRIFLPANTSELEDLIYHLEQKLESLEKATKLCSKEIDLLKEYKTALISEVVTGKVDVRDEIIAESPELVS